MSICPCENPKKKPNFERQLMMELKHCLTVTVMIWCHILFIALAIIFINMITF